MQKKKKNNKNTIALIVCVAIIAVLCVFVGLIIHAWVNYNENVKISETSKNSVVEQAEPAKDDVPVKEEEVAPPKDEIKEEPEKESISSKGEVSALSKSVSKAFNAVEAEYSYGIVNLNDGYIYIENTDKIYNDMAINAFLLDYVSNGIYLGTFDYDTPVGDYNGSQLMIKAFTDRNSDAAKTLINYFGTAKINSYLASKGYTGTVLSDVEGESYTTTEDIIRLMETMYQNTGFFPYSDMYKKMRNSAAKSNIKESLPAGCSAVDIGYTSGDQSFEAGIIYTPNGNFVFVCTADSADDEIGSAVSKSASAICKAAAAQ